MNPHPIFHAIERLVSADTFVPFVIVMASGESIEIQHREFAYPVKGWGLVIVQRPQDDAARMINPEHIRELTRRDESKKSA